MYLSRIPTKTKDGKLSHLCILLRESYRENGKVKNRTIANITHAKPEEIEAIELALKHKGDLTALNSVEEIQLTQGKSVGGVWVVQQVAKRLGIDKALGKSRNGKLALWQVIARVLEQGSRLSAVRLAGRQAACEVLGIKKAFNEDHLYRNLEWLCRVQRKIEKRLFERRKSKPELFLYDITSSYLEGMENELGSWGLSREKKRGKQQVLVGLLCDQEGEPVSVEVYDGSVRDFTTLDGQVKKTAGDFGCSRVTFVGDRGMVKSGQIKNLGEAGFNYITAITKSQIRKLVKEGVFQLSLFEDELCEVIHGQVRYILRRNPVRAEELEKTREGKKQTINQMVEEAKKYLKEHKRAKPGTQLKKIRKKIDKLKVSRWLSVKGRGRQINLKEDKKARRKEAQLDGCYVIKTDLLETDKQIVHDRYKDLREVEEAFKVCKTGLLELRPWYVWTEESTRGHALVVMLAYLVTRHLKKAWKGLNFRVKEGVRELNTVCTTLVEVEGKGKLHRVPRPSEKVAELLSAVDVKLPEILPDTGIRVVSRKKLQNQRK